jgi:hypothetical protein
MLMDVHWQRKKARSSGMSNPRINEWYDCAMANGALGGKLIGAGGGGFLMFYAGDKTRLRHAMREKGLQEVRFRFDFEGTKVLAFSDISDPFWFISLILAAYLVFACIRKRLDDLSLVIAVAGSLTLLATILYQNNGHVGGLVSLAVRIPSFFAGVIAGRLLCAGTAELRFNLVLGLGLLCFYYQTFFRAAADNYTLPAFGLIAGWLGIRHYLVKFFPGRVFLAAFALLGLISYEIYLFHQPFIRDYNLYFYNQILKNPDPSHRQLLKGIFGGLCVTLAVSVGVHKAFEWAWSRLRLRAATPAVVT